MRTGQSSFQFIPIELSYNFLDVASSLHAVMHQLFPRSLLEPNSKTTILQLGGSELTTCPGCETEFQNMAVRISRRELDVLRMVARGHDSKRIAEMLFISKRTVDFHVNSLLRKFSVNNRIHALRAACQIGILPFEPHSLSFMWACEEDDRKMA